MTEELSSQYNWQAVEREVQQLWHDANLFHADPNAGGPPYAIVIPPPNVTAALHMGHALNNTLQDILIRYHRMLGHNTVWIPGTDHAGIATQTVVEKRVLAEEGKRRTDFQRDQFVARIQAWKDEYETRILGQLRAMGCSCDWDRTRFTMDDVCARAVRQAFFKLFHDNLIYRGKRLVNWDPATQTALADDEVEMHEIDGHFWYLQYPLIDSVMIDGRLVDHVTVATTRPETMLGDTAVAMNPRDPRAATLVGKTVRLPIVNRPIPIVADDHVTLPDPKSDDVKAQFSTGFLKVTPAHDPNDYDIGRRHDLPVINVMAPDGTISDQHGWSDVGGADFVLGLDRYEAREAIVEWFRENELLENVKPYRHSVGHSYRSHVAIEPYLSDQWYVRVTDPRLSHAALAAMADDQYEPSPEHAHKRQTAAQPWQNRLRFYPERYAKTFQSWHENIRDWCISRQLWWGHRIPVWTLADLDAKLADDVAATLDRWRTEGKIARHQSDSGATYFCPRPEFEKEFAAYVEQRGFTQDPDVLDTWFSSALWPFSTFGWPNPADFPAEFPEGDAALATWNPTSVLVTARDIITLWVSRMVMTNLYFLNRLPFHDVCINAMIQDGEGRKMSKSLGNGIDPLDIIEIYGADAMRYSLAYLCTGMQDIRMPVKTETLPDGRKINTSERFEIGRSLATKLWNAARLVLMNLENAEPPQTLNAADLPLEDRWILAKLKAAADQLSTDLDRYLYDDAAMTFYRFFWNEFCDWYLEWIKSRLYSQGETRRTAQQLAAFCLDQILRMAHPFMPHISEKLWAELNRRYPTRGVETLQTPNQPLTVSSWPKPQPAWADTTATQHVELLQQIIRTLREIRANINQSRATEKQKSIAKLPSADLRCAATTAELVLQNRKTILELAGLETLRINPADFTTTGAASRVVTDPAGQTLELAAPVAGLIDVNQERKRLTRELEELNLHIQRSQARLANPSFAQKAPPNVVEEHRQTLADLQSKRDTLEQALKELA